MPDTPRPSSSPDIRAARYLIDIDVDGFTHGAEGVGRLPDGKVCFVAYALPGERVRVRVVEQRKRWARAELVEVLVGSPERVDPPCPYAGPVPAAGTPPCGGCLLQHATPRLQAELKQRVVREQLERIGRLPDPPVAPTQSLAPLGYRNVARFAVRADDGALGFHRLRSGEVVPIDRCLLLHERVQRVRDAAGDGWAGAEEVTVRAALGTPDDHPSSRGALVIRPAAEGGIDLAPGDLPLALLAASGRSVDLRDGTTIVEHVGGFDFRVSATSFFQSSTEGAEALLRLVRAAAAAGPGDTALDLYAGVGLFARGLAADGAAVTAVESHAQACADAVANLAGTGADVVGADAGAVVGRMVAEGGTVDVVVLDPPRAGAGPQLCAALARLGARTVVYVSCDPAALARDARVLVDSGLRLASAIPVDQFAQTAHIETVATFSA
jgi:tRNA/tmRNA/rRNA uracil-C5-methylase (TrmA/RlmC/RlmD family)